MTRSGMVEGNGAALYPSVSRLAASATSPSLRDGEDREEER